MSYRTEIIDGFMDAMRARFQMDDVLKATSILKLKNWPEYDSPDLKGFEVQKVLLSWQLHALLNLFVLHFEFQMHDFFVPISWCYTRLQYS